MSHSNDRPYSVKRSRQNALADLAPGQKHCGRLPLATYTSSTNGPDGRHTYEPQESAGSTGGTQFLSDRERESLRATHHARLGL